MLWHSAAAGVFDLKDAVIESLNSAMRAGKSIVNTVIFIMLIN
jgi:delta-aminolevulinic acid dehydratase/porphobilinogen synthase